MTVIDYLSSLINVSPALAETLRRTLKTQKLLKKHLLHDEGQICHRLYFVEKGLVRTFYYHPDGRDITEWFVAEPLFSRTFRRFDPLFADLSRT